MKEKITIPIKLTNDIEFRMRSYIEQRIREVSVSSSGNFQYEFRTEMYRKLAEDIMIWVDLRDEIFIQSKTNQIKQ